MRGVLILTYIIVQIHHSFLVTMQAHIALELHWTRSLEPRETDRQAELYQAKIVHLAFTFLRVRQMHFRCHQLRHRGWQVLDFVSFVRNGQ